MRFGLLIMAVFFDLFGLKQSEFKYDENGHILFYEVIETELSHAQLMDNAQKLIPPSKKTSNNRNGRFEKASSMRLYRKSLGKSPHGELDFSIMLEIKDNRYRYIIKDFVFYPMKRNRYGKFERVKYKASLLNEKVASPDKLWMQHKNTILTRVDKVIENIKREMATIKYEESKPEGIKINDDW